MTTADNTERGFAFFFGKSIIAALREKKKAGEENLKICAKKMKKGYI